MCLVLFWQFVIFFFFFFFFFLDDKFYVFDCVYESKRITTLFFYSVSDLTSASKSIVIKTLCFSFHTTNITQQISHNKYHTTKTNLNQKIQLFENNPCFATLGHLDALFLSSTAAATTTTTTTTITIAM